VPGGRTPLLGLSQYAGEPVAVIDLVKLSQGQGSRGGHPVVVLLRCGSNPAPGIVGVAVDEAVRLVRISDGELPTTVDGPVSDGVMVAGLELRLVNPMRIGTNGVGERS